MSYCRWSTDDYQCDLYCYRDVGGHYVTSVARGRYVFAEPLPEEVPFDTEHAEEWLRRHEKVMAIIEKSHLEQTTLKYAGETFYDRDPRVWLTRLHELKGLGYQFPQYVIDDAVEAVIEDGG